MLTIGKGRSWTVLVLLPALPLYNLALQVPRAGQPLLWRAAPPKAAAQAVQTMALPLWKAALLKGAAQALRQVGTLRQAEAAPLRATIHHATMASVPCPTPPAATFVVTMAAKLQSNTAVSSSKTGRQIPSARTSRPCREAALPPVAATLKPVVTALRPVAIPKPAAILKPVAIPRLVAATPRPVVILQAAVLPQPAAATPPRAAPAPVLKALILKAAAATAAAPATAVSAHNQCPVQSGATSAATAAANQPNNTAASLCRTTRPTHFALASNLLLPPAEIAPLLVAAAPVLAATLRLAVTRRLVEIPKLAAQQPRPAIPAPHPPPLPLPAPTSKLRVPTVAITAKTASLLQAGNPPTRTALPMPIMAGAILVSGIRLSDILTLLNWRHRARRR